MKLKVSPKIFEDFAGLAIGVIVIKHSDNNGNPPEIVELLRSAEKEIHEILDIDPVNSYPKIAAWREAHRKFGNNPKKNPPSVQSIVRRVEI